MARLNDEPRESAAADESITSKGKGPEVEPKKRKSMIPKPETDDDGNAPSPYYIENEAQLKDWMNKDPAATSFMLQELRKENNGLVDSYNLCIEEFNALIKKNDLLQDRYKALLNQEGGVLIGEPHSGNTPGPGFGLEQSTMKISTSKKLPDPSILTDEKDPLIDDWLSVMRNKLEGNADWYQTDLQEKAYVRTRLGGDAIRHLSSRFKKDSVKSFFTAEEIFDELNLIFGDPNKRINSIKAFRRLKQIGQYKDFFTFWAEFQRLASDAELYNKEMLLEDLKDKLSYDLQKAMVNESYGATDLHAFAKKCQYTDQVLKDVDSKARYRSEAASGGFAAAAENKGQSANQSGVINPKPDGGFSRQNTPAPAIASGPLAFRALTASSVVGQVNAFLCFKCGLPGHMAKNCRRGNSHSTPRIQEIVEADESDSRKDNPQ